VTYTVVVAVLFAVLGSFVVGPMLAVFEIAVPGAVVAVTSTASGKRTVVPEVTAAPEHTPALPGQQEIFPVPPTPGMVGHVQPAGTPSETNVVFVGTVSVKVTFVAEAGPLFVTVCV
jgi:hypothetical protein